MLSTSDCRAVHTPLEFIMAKPRAGGPRKKTRKFDGKGFRLKSTSKTKTLAKKSAKASRGSGKKARMVKNKQGWSVYTRG